MRPSLIQVDVAVNSDHWQKLDFNAEDTARTIIPLAFSMADAPECLRNAEIDVSIVLTDDEAVRLLNRDYRNMDKPTNVLSFSALEAEEGDFIPPPGQPLSAGDIILAYETIQRESVAQKKTFRNHYTHLLVHGMLHLLGYDHENETDAEIMESLEIRVLKFCGINDPYFELESMA